MSAFPAALGGSAGGLAGSALAQFVAGLADRAGSEDWLKGPYGPPFFNIALFMGIMYGAIALGIARRPKAALLGFLGPFLGIAAPMALLTRAFRWDWGHEGAAPSAAWYYAVVVVFVLAVWGTIFALGALIAERPWRGALASVAGAFGGYLGLLGLFWLVPGLLRLPLPARSLLAQPIVLMDGLLTGLGMGLGIWVSRRSHAKQNSDR